jgi:hypothetical protein
MLERPLGVHRVGSKSRDVISGSILEASLLLLAGRLFAILVWYVLARR